MTGEDLFGGCFLVTVGGFLLLGGVTMVQKMKSPGPGVLLSIIGCVAILLAIAFQIESNTKR
jgi:hypothetical protein